jgi:hypothetical protein
MSIEFYITTPNNRGIHLSEKISLPVMERFTKSKTFNTGVSIHVQWKKNHLLK